MNTFGRSNFVDLVVSLPQQGFLINIFVTRSDEESVERGMGGREGGGLIFLLYIKAVDECLKHVTEALEYFSRFSW